MILSDAFQMGNEQKLAFASLALQAEYGGTTETEQISTDFYVEHYAPSSFLQQVIKSFCTIERFHNRDAFHFHSSSD